jgi:nucleoside-diphosphate-sugar epimerase
LKILINGGAGYIGSVLIGHLLRAGHQVTVLDNLIFGQRSLFGFCSNPNFDFVFGDCRNVDTLKPLVAKADAIIHLAAVVGAPACDRDVEYATTLNFGSVETLSKLVSKDQKIVYPCTNSGYGTQSGDVFCTEETPLEPISVYGRTKADAEKLLLDTGNAVAFRLATVFGVSPRMRVDLLVNDFTYKAYKDGYLVLYESHFQRNFLGIEDVARGMLFALDNYDRIKGEPYNLGLDSANINKLQLAEKIKEHVPKLYIHEAAVGTDPDKRNYVVSNDKLRKAGFEATMTLDEGIVGLLKAYKMFGRSEFGNV